MKKVFFALTSLSLLVGCGDSEISDVKLETKEDSVSYAMGVIISNNIFQNKDFGEVVNPAIFAEALKDVKKGDSSEAITIEQANEILTKFSNSLVEKDKKKGEDFLAENKTKEGVQVTPSGLQYQVITEGTGVKPAPTDVVKVHYHGTLINGTVFDSSVERGEPAQFPVNQVIAGWTEALQLMPVGSKWKLFIPQELAYGPRGAGQAIPPYAALVFEVELLEITRQGESAE